MLFVPTQSILAFEATNLTDNPSSTIGTSVTPGASDAEGSWTTLIASGSITEDIYGIHIKVHSGGTSTALKRHVLDLGIDPAGGTSFTAIISNIVCGASATLGTRPGTTEFYFPFFIPAGSTFGCRIQGSNATAGTVRVVACLYGQRSRPSVFPVGTFSETFGVSGSNGTSVTPGNAADGSWTSIGTTTNPLWWWQLGYQISNAAITAEYTYLELAWGDASNKHTILKDMHGGHSEEMIGYRTLSQKCWHSAYQPVPGGTNLYVRARCNNAPDTGYQVGVIGVGG